jgi:hypothetical protein
MSIEDEKLRFREALIERMELTGVGAAEISRRTGVPKGVIDKLRQRRTDVTNVYDAILLARFFGQTVEDFIGLRRKPGKIDEIVEMIALLPPDLRDVIHAQIRAAVKVHMKD